MRKFMATLVFVSTVLTIGFGAGSHASAAAAKCSDPTAIMCNGATSSQNFIDKVNKNAPGDLKAVYGDYGLVPAQYAQFAATAKNGTLYADGRIEVNGDVVGHSTSNLGRVQTNDFTKKVTVKGKDYWAGPFGSTFHANKTAVMVMFDTYGVMKFAVITSCGNPQRIQPVNATGTCDLLQKHTVAGKKNTYGFTTKASATKGAKVVSVEYNFGGKRVTVNDLSKPYQYTFTKDTRVEASPRIKLPGGFIVALPINTNCAVQIDFQNDTPKPKPTPAPKPVPTPAPAPTPTPAVTAACSSLQSTAIDAPKRNYSFTANSTSSDGVTLQTVDFNYGDNTAAQSVTASDSSATATHQYTASGTYTVTASLHFNDGTTDYSATCQSPLTIADATSAPVTTTDDTDEADTDSCTTATTSDTDDDDSATTTDDSDTADDSTVTAQDDCNDELINTGPGTIAVGIFGGASVIAAAGHFAIRRRLGL